MKGKRLLSVLVAVVVLFVALPIPAMAAIFTDDGYASQMIYSYREQVKKDAWGLKEDVYFSRQYENYRGENFTVSQSGTYRIYLRFVPSSFVTYDFYDGAMAVYAGDAPGRTDSLSSTPVWSYYLAISIPENAYTYAQSFSLEAGQHYFLTIPAFHAHSSASNPYTIGYDLYLQNTGVTESDLHHRVVDYTHGGTSRGGGASRRYNTVEVKDKDGNVLEGPGDDALTGGDLWILNEEQKTVNLITNEGSKSYTYNNYTYNTETGETIVYTTTNETIKITSYEEHVNVNYVDNSGTTIIYNYYYTPDPGGSSSEPDNPGGSSEPDNPGGSSSEPDKPGGDDGDGGFSWDWLWDLIKGLGSFILNLIGTLGSLLADAFKSVTGLFDFIGSFVGFLGGAFSFIPAEIWTLIGAGIAVSIVLRFLKR